MDGHDSCGHDGEGEPAHIPCAGAEARGGAVGATAPGDSHVAVVAHFGAGLAADAHTSSTACGTPSEGSDGSTSVDCTGGGGASAASALPALPGLPVVPGAAPAGARPPQLPGGSTTGVADACSGAAALPAADTLQHELHGKLAAVADALLNAPREHLARVEAAAAVDADAALDTPLRTLSVPSIIDVVRACGVSAVDGGQRLWQVHRASRVTAWALRWPLWRRCGGCQAAAAVADHTHTSSVERQQVLGMVCEALVRLGLEGGARGPECSHSALTCGATRLQGGCWRRVVTHVATLHADEPGLPHVALACAVREERQGRSVNPVSRLTCRAAEVGCGCSW